MTTASLLTHSVTVCGLLPSDDWTGRRALVLFIRRCFTNITHRPMPTSTLLRRDVRGFLRYFVSPNQYNYEIRSIYNSKRPTVIANVHYELSFAGLRKGGFRCVAYALQG